MSTAATGLRERKKVRTRRQIELATFTLVAKQGWSATTIADIAEAAEVAPRTISAYFPTKLDIVFSTTSERASLLAECLDDPAVSIVDGMKSWLARAVEYHDHDWEELRWLAIKADTELLAHDRLGFVEHANLVAEAAGRRTGQPADALGPRMIGACAMTLVLGFRDYIDRDVTDDFAQVAAEGFEILERVYAAVADS